MEPIHRLMTPLAAALRDAGSPSTYAGHARELTSAVVTASLWPLGLAASQLPSMRYSTDATPVPASVADSAPGRFFSTWWFAAWGFDWLYDALFKAPFVWAARINRNDFIDGLIGLIPAGLRGAASLATATQTGGLRWYAAVAGAGLCLLIAVVALH